MRNIQLKFYIILSLSLVFILLGITIPNLISNKINDKLTSRYILKKKDNKNEGYRQFESITKDGVPIYLKMVFYNVTNPKDVMNGSKPILSEVGPYIYNEYREKINITFEDEPYNEGDVKIKFTEYKYYKFNKKLSKELKDSDKVTIISPPTWTFVNGVIKGELQTALDSYFFLNGNPFEELPYKGFFITKTINEILWGYESKFVTILNTLKTELGLGPKDGIPNIPTKIHFQKNHTSIKNAIEEDCCTTVYSGSSNTRLMRQTYKIRNSEYNTIWPKYDKKKNVTTYLRYNGTDGTQFHLGVKKTDRLQFYTDKLKRVLQLEYKENDEVMGVECLKFEAPHWIGNNVKQSPSNKIYGQYGPRGVFNASGYAPFAPIEWSLPHFYKADKSYREYIPGMKKIDPSKDESYVCVEPNTGSVVQGRKRLQANLLVQNLDTMFPKMNFTGLFPIAYAQETADITEAKAEKIRDELYFAQGMAVTIKVLGYGLGVAFAFLGIYYLNKEMKKVTTGVYTRIQTT